MVTRRKQQLGQDRARFQNRLDASGTDAHVFKIGRDDGGPLFMMGFIVAIAVGVVLCIWAYFA